MRHRAQPSRHYDASAPWAREPRLRTVVHLPLRTQRSNRWVYLTCVVLGVVLGLLLRGWQ